MAYHTFIGCHWFDIVSQNGQNEYCGCYGLKENACSHGREDSLVFHLSRFHLMSVEMDRCCRFGRSHFKIAAMQWFQVLSLPIFLRCQWQAY
jgi:hypothetical protein